jgi:hypothetical protein
MVLTRPLGVPAAKMVVSTAVVSVGMVVHTVEVDVSLSRHSVY